MIWKERVVASFKVLSRHLPGGLRKTWSISQDSRPPGQILNPGPPEQEVQVLTTQRRRSVAREQKYEQVGGEVGGAWNVTQGPGWRKVCQTKHRDQGTEENIWT
jgi:hypothetical protein